jgi:DAACS family dicarboxylate/amino acid:cation (Na+ or H+) symporter
MDGSRRQSGLRLSSPTARILIAMVLGGLAGSVLGPRVGRIGEAGQAVIGLIKMLAAPLILFAVLDAFLRTTIRAKSGLILLGISAVNAASAVAIGLILANTLRPGRSLSIPAGLSSSPGAVPGVRPVRFLDDLLGLLPTNLVDPFRTNAIAPIVVLAVLGGAALRRYKHERIAAGSRDYLPIEWLVAGVLRALELMLGWVVALLPVAIFAVMAQTVGTQGLAPLRGLAAYLGVVILGLLLHVGLVYQSWIVLVARVPLRAFWAALRAPLACAAGSSSSLATLPVTLRSLKAMGVSDGSARMSACVMTNLNNDGILLYEAMAALIVAQASGIPLTLGEQLGVAATCVLASVGIAGVPEAGLISLAVVLAGARLPLDVLPLLLSVDWILGRCRAMTNVVGDVVGAAVLDRLGGAPGTDLDPEPTGIVDEPSTLAIVA